MDRGGRDAATADAWGTPPWRLPAPIPPRTAAGLAVDVAIVGAGLTGLATAIEAARAMPGARVAVIEAARAGAGASGRTGGIVLEDTAAGPVAGLGDCIASLGEVVRRHAIDCDLRIDRCWETARPREPGDSPIAWNDGGTMRVVADVPGGTVDPGRLLAGLAAAAEAAGVTIVEGATVTGIVEGPGGSIDLRVPGGVVRTRDVVLATNATTPGLPGAPGDVRCVQTLAIATEPLADDVLEAMGWGSRTPFYTVDLPYLWGRIAPDGRAVVGSGLVFRDGGPHEARIDDADVVEGHADLERRVRGLHRALRGVRITHRWMGPVDFRPGARPVLGRGGPRGRVIGACGYAGHGVALAIRVGRVLANVLAGRAEVP